MSQASGERVEFTVTEHFERNTVMWTARAGREQIVQVTQRLFGSMCDSGELIDAIAEHYSVERGAVTFDNKRQRRNQPFRYVPKRGWVQLPATPAKPDECGHGPDQNGCDLRLCGGIPPEWVPLDRNVETPAVEQTRGESGVVTVVRDLTRMVAQWTGLNVDGLRFADNGWSDMRHGARKLAGYEFTVGGFDVRVLTYQSKHALERYPRNYGAVYVGRTRIGAAIDMEGPYTTWAPEVARLVIGVVEVLHDAREVEQRRPERGWRMKSVPPGHLVEHTTGLAVVKESRVGGTTLVVRDLLGREHYADRAQAGWWAVIPAARDAHGDTFARFEQRMAWRRRLIEHRHGNPACRQPGRPGGCRECIGEVMGPQDEHGHHLGRYAAAPWCWFCGSRPGSPEAEQQCPGLPKRLPADYERAQLERAAAGGEPEPDAEPAPDYGVDVDGVLVAVARRVDLTAEQEPEPVVEPEPVDDDLAQRAQEFAASVDRTDGELDAAILANRENPTPESEARVMAAARQHQQAFFAEERAELMAKQNGPRPSDAPEADAEAFGSAAAVYEVGDRVRVRVGFREASGRVTVVEQVGCDRVYEVLRAGLGSICVGAEQLRPDPTPAPEVGQTWVCDAVGATVTVRSVHEDGLTADTERGSVILAAPDWRLVEQAEAEPEPDVWGDLLDLLGV